MKLNKKPLKGKKWKEEDENDKESKAMERKKAKCKGIKKLKGKYRAECSK